MTEETRTYKDPFRGELVLTKVNQRSMNAMGEDRVDSLWADDRGGLYWFIESSAAIEPIEPIYVSSYIAQMIGESVRMRHRYFGESRKCLCDPSTFPPLGKFTDFCWTCDAFRDRKPKPMELEDFSKHDWAHMHDCIQYVRKTSPSQVEMEALFRTLPEDMKGDAREWGMNDTLWRDNFITWLTKEQTNTTTQNDNA